MKVVAPVRTPKKIVNAHTLRLAVMGLMLLSNSAFAQALLSADTPIVKLACNVFSILSGPAAFLIGLIVIVVGGVSIAIGGKRVIGGVVWGILGVGIALSAGQIAKAIFSGDTLCAVA